MHLNDPQFKWAPNINADPEDPGPLNFIFANQFKLTLNQSEINRFYPISC